MTKKLRRSPDVANAADVAAELRKRMSGIGDVKLHKLLFFVQGTHLAWEGVPAFRERIEAWDMGPVVAALWRDEKRGRLSRAAVKPVSRTVSDVVTNVVARYGRLSGQDLIELTHRSGPWPEVTEGGAHVRNQVIGNDVLARHAARLAPELDELRERIDAVRDDLPFVADAPGDLDRLVAAHSSR